MANKVEDLVNVILDSYNECDITARIDEENMLNKDILIEIIDEIRKVLFPGFFDNNKVRSEYLKFLVGERLEFIQYHLKKQVSNAFANQDVCRECSKAQAEEKAEEVVFEFLKRIPKIREYLNTDIQAAYDGDPAAYSTDEIIFCNVPEILPSYITITRLLIPITSIMSLEFMITATPWAASSCMIW